MDGQGSPQASGRISVGYKLHDQPDIFRSGCNRYYGPRTTTEPQNRLQGSGQVRAPYQASDHPAVADQRQIRSNDRRSAQGIRSERGEIPDRAQSGYGSDSRDLFGFGSTRRPRPDTLLAHADYGEPQEFYIPHRRRGLEGAAAGLSSGASEAHEFQFVFPREQHGRPAVIPGDKLLGVEFNHPEIRGPGERILIQFKVEKMISQGSVTY